LLKSKGSNSKGGEKAKNILNLGFSFKPGTKSNPTLMVEMIASYLEQTINQYY
jgi:hypothetical protein